MSKVQTIFKITLLQTQTDEFEKWKEFIQASGFFGGHPGDELLKLTTRITSLDELETTLKLLAENTSNCIVLDRKDALSFHLSEVQRISRHIAEDFKKRRKTLWQASENTGT
jgi:hypothetical protein